MKESCKFELTFSGYIPVDTTTQLETATINQTIVCPIYNLYVRLLLSQEIKAQVSLRQRSIWFLLLCCCKKAKGLPTKTKTDHRWLKSTCQSGVKNVLPIMFGVGRWSWSASRQCHVSTLMTCFDRQWPEKEQHSKNGPCQSHKIHKKKPWTVFVQNVDQKLFKPRKKHLLICDCYLHVMLNTSSSVFKFSLHDLFSRV